ncbi:hypothetical protein [uncultured Rothia sp.]|uniref:hypothetical protein n=1 Tax=uncultured Rothia sp. TaxID=316088 RepID=UPI003217DB5E
MTRLISQGALGIILVATCALAGCAPATNFDELKPQEVNSEHIDQLSEWIIPPNDAEQARREFVSRCVARQGGKYQEALRDFSVATSLSNGLTSEDLRATAYAPKPTKESPVAQSNQKGQQAYTGNVKNGTVSAQLMEFDSGDIAIDGCFAQSLQYVYGSVEDGLKASILAPQFARSLAEDVRQDEDYKQLVSNWSTCMSEHDYSDLETVESASDLAMLLPEAKRQNLANTDADCRDSVDFEHKIHEIEQTYFEAVYDRVKQFDKEFEQIHQSAADNVAKDREDPKDSSPVTPPTPSESASSQ